ncbi:hypothetical protein [Agaribacter flavus]|uniref:Transporter substrate-binding domain-containing protein n=1 Tax=Agaribacter flavus TaxID=1902781 RepID=A0ABV7FSN1_9ALTE
MRLVVNIVFFILSVPFALASDDLVIHTTPVNPQHADLHQILVKSYQSLDVPVVFTTLPYTRGAISANYGVIDGLDLRLESHAKEYKNLVKVNYPVYISNIVLVVDKQQCISCSTSKISSIASVSGYNFQSHFDSEVLLNSKSVEFADHGKLFKFFDGERVEGIVVGDIFLPQKYLDNPRYQVYRLGSQKVFHYLNEKHRELAKKLASNFKRLNELIPAGSATSRSNTPKAQTAGMTFSGNISLDHSQELSQ